MTGDKAPNGRSFIDPETWYARLPTAHVAAGALITDSAGQILLVKPSYRDHWLLPGGWANHNEPPEAACARELAEELGLDVPIGRLLVADWAPAYGKRPRPVSYYLFDAGTISDPAQIHVRDSELSGHDFFPADQAESLLDAATASRLAAALAARRTGNTTYLPQDGRVLSSLVIAVLGRFGPGFHT